MAEQPTQEAGFARPQLYEVGYHLVANIPEENVGEEALRLRNLINEAGGTFVGEELPKRHTLAYTIVKRVGGKREKHTTSYVGWITFEASSAIAEQVNIALRSVDTILRYLVVETYKPEPVGLSPRSVLKKPARETETPVDTGVKQEQQEEVSAEALDKEIEKLVAE